MSTTKKGFSSKKIQKQLGQKRYEHVWAIVHKLRKAMGNRNSRYTLESSEIEQEKGIRGPGAFGKENVAIMAESKVLEDVKVVKNQLNVVISKQKI